MKSRRLFSIVSLILVFCLTFSGCGCKHDWQDANCQGPKTCALCGKTEGEAGTHHYKIFETAPTCTEPGYRVNACTVCGLEEKTPIADPAGHTSLGGRCIICGEVLDDDTKNIILIIGDGMGKNHITAGELMSGETYGIRQWDKISVNTNSLKANGKEGTTDSAAAATALATGTLTLNTRVGIDKDGNELETILDYAKSIGKKTGIVTTDYIHGATPAGFSAHAPNRTDTDVILQSQLTCNVDLMLASASESVSAIRNDIVQHGYTYCTTLSEARKNLSANRLYCALEMEGYSDSMRATTLEEAAMLAIDYLENEEGFVLVIEQAHIDKFSHNNKFSDMVSMVNSFKMTVDAVTAWTDKRADTAILITSDHETGGLSVSKTIRYEDMAVTNDYEEVYYSFSSKDHTDAEVWLFVHGAKVDFQSLPTYRITGLIKNTDIPYIMKELLK